MTLTATALEAPMHFLIEKQNEPYQKYGEVSIAGKKCSGGQEHLYKNRLALGWERCGA